MKGNMFMTLGILILIAFVLSLFLIQVPFTSGVPVILMMSLGIVPACAIALIALGRFMNPVLSIVVFIVVCAIIMISGGQLI